MKVIPREVVKRKPITWSLEIRKLQKELILNSFQKKVLIGTILGDGCLTPNAYGKNYRLQIEQAAKEKKYEGESEQLRECLAKNFYLETSLHKDKKYWRIYIFPVSVPQFVKLAREIVFPEFNYKFPFY